MRRFILFRFWVAYKRFLDRKFEIQGWFPSLMLDLTLDPNKPFYAKDSFPLIKCLVWHSSHDLLETKRDLMMKALSNLEYVKKY